MPDGTSTTLLAGPSSDDAARASIPPPDINALLANFMSDIGGLPEPKLGPADAAAAQVIKESIVASGLPRECLPPLIKSLAKKADADPAEMVREVMRARATLDDARARPPLDADASVSPFLFPNGEASDNPNALSGVLEQIVRVIERRVVVSRQATWAIALWVACTWGVRQPGQPGGPSIFPRLLITAPTKRAGKSTLLETVMALSHSPIMASNISVAALFRTITAFFPTLGLDEADNSLRNNPELVGVTNSGHARNGSVLRTVEIQTRNAAGGSKKDFDPRAFSTFAPMVIAGIGHQAGTTADRSIRVQLQRQPASALGDPLDFDRLAQIRERVAPHLAALGEAMAQAMAGGSSISFLPSIGSRDRDNWRPLIRVADLAGGVWPSRVQSALAAMCQDADDRRSSPEQLLADIREFARERRLETLQGYLRHRARRAGVSAAPAPAHPLALGGPGTQPYARPYAFILSADLAPWLMDLDSSPLAKERDVGAAKNKIAAMLRGFRIHPEKRASGRGYPLKTLRDAWRRYL